MNIVKEEIEINKMKKYNALVFLSFLSFLALLDPPKTLWFMFFLFFLFFLIPAEVLKRKKRGSKDEKGT